MRTHKYGALGWTQGGGNCNPDAVINEYMGLGKAQRYTGGGKSTGKADNVPSEETKQRRAHKSHAGGLFQRQSILSLPIIGFLGLGGKRTSYPVETIVGDYAGKGKTDGLPTTNDNGELDLVYRQVNEDGPGPMAVTVDTTSAGTDYKAFTSVKVIQNVPGDGFVGLSLGTNTNYNMKIKLNPDMRSSAEFEQLRRRPEGENATAAASTGIDVGGGGEQQQQQQRDGDRRRTMGRQVVDQFREAL
ncbi:cell surface protein (Mas1) [Akanthomyces lecanii RCEF 1005]|uniref:Cell surface protein (Mas1) n=1 Tax=Akanthomyces lecanii RCEF 1005 TaxID=1081108 RepID=A0A168IWW1_CORDF|nr:cell surface protein (Mas1) [Akanthomyces lecanii RCEF 1005]